MEYLLKQIVELKRELKQKTSELANMKSKPVVKKDKPKTRAQLLEEKNPLDYTDEELYEYERIKRAEKKKDIADFMKRHPSGKVRKLTPEQINEKAHKHAMKSIKGDIKKLAAEEKLAKEESERKLFDSL